MSSGKVSNKYRKNPPIRRVSTNQSLSRDSTQSFNRVDVELTVFSRDSALGVRQGGSAGVGGRGTSGYLGHLLLLSEAPGDHKIYTFFGYFSILHLFTFLSQNSPRKGSQKCQKSEKSMRNHPPDLALNSYLQKGPPKCENRILFNVLSLFPKVPGTPKSITNWTPNGSRNCNL